MHMVAARLGSKSPGWVKPCLGCTMGLKMLLSLFKVFISGSEGGLCSE